MNDLHVMPMSSPFGVGPTFEVVLHADVLTFHGNTVATAGRYQAQQGKTITELLAEFDALRRKSDDDPDEGDDERELEILRDLADVCRPIEAGTIRLVLDVSTDHLPAHVLDAPLTPYEQVIPSPLGYEVGTGYLLHVPNDPDEGIEEDFPDVILAVQRFARGFGCDYVLFEPGARGVMDLPRWE